MYYPYFISYMLAGLFIALLVFGWSMKNGQFQDQERARFLPLVGMPQEDQSAQMPRASRFAMAAFIGLVCIVLCTSFAMVIFALLRVKL
jgi:cbb3-type cytochrome oxidase maturation protein